MERFLPFLFFLVLLLLFPLLDTLGVPLPRPPTPRPRRLGDDFRAVLEADEFEVLDLELFFLFEADACVTFLVGLEAPRARPLPEFFPFIVEINF